MSFTNFLFNLFVFQNHTVKMLDLIKKYDLFGNLELILNNLFTSNVSDDPCCSGSSSRGNFYVLNFNYVCGKNYNQEYNVFRELRKLDRY